jgi:N-hydroxyarylamine O-acetyltransferase
MNHDQVEKYIHRIKINQIQGIDSDTLKNLQKQHLLNVPFENLDIHSGIPIKIDTDKFFKKIVDNGRGGFCYELNGLFNELLIALGFSTKLISARVANSEGGFGNEFDHMAIITRIDSDEWLVDVGFGEFSQWPLKLVKDIVQKDPRGDFVIEQYDDVYFVVKKLLDKLATENQYIFSLEERRLPEFEEMCNYHQTSPKSHFTQNRMCSIALPDGRITLTNKSLKITKDSIVTEENIMGEVDFRDKLAAVFGIRTA